MPGYDRERIVNTTPKQLDDLTCGICYGILYIPLMTDCCQQTYCNGCINEWISGHNTCPNCRKSIHNHELRPVPRLLKSMIDDLHIKCEFSDKGCSASVTIEQLEGHMKCCPHNPKAVCSTCHLEKSSDHNCVDSLIAEINKLKLNHHSNGNTSSVNHILLIEEARSNMSNHQLIKRANSSDKLVNYVIGKCMEGLKGKNHFREISEYLHDCLLEHYEYGWHNWCVMVGSDNQFNLTHTVDIKFESYIILKFSQIKIAIMSMRK